MADLQILKNKLQILISKKESFFANMNRIYDLSKKISERSMRSNSEFLTISSKLDKDLERFEKILDEIHDITLTLDNTKVPSFRELDAFTDLYYAVLTVRNDILKSEKANDDGRLHSRPSLKIKLPAIEIPSFDGNIENWSIFYESFKANIHENCDLSNSQRVQYLIGKLTDNARRILAGIIPTGDTYKIIWDSLVQKYQDVRTLGTYYLNNIFDLKACHYSAYSLDSFVEKYSASISALKVLNLPDLADFILMNCALRKLDVQTTQAFETSVKNQTIPSYSDLISFVQNQAKILERSGAYNASSSPRARVKTNIQKTVNPVRSHAFVAREDAPADGAGSCILCKKIDHNKLEDCSRFKNWGSPRDKFNFIKSKRGCIKCLRVSHVFPACTARSRCNVCQSEGHHSLLHFGQKNDKVYSNTHLQIDVNGSSPPVSLNNQPEFVVESTEIGMDLMKPASLSNVTYSNKVSEENVLLPIKPSVTLNVNSNEKSDIILLATAQVFAWSENCQDKTIIRCLLDNGSQNHLITLDCCNKMNLRITPLKNSVIRGVGLSSRPIHGYVSFKIQSRHDPEVKYNLNALVVDCITDQLPLSMVNKSEMHYLNELPMADLSWNIPGKIEVVLGAQLFPQIFIGGLKRSGSGAPPASSTSLGYVLMGDCPAKMCSTVSSSSQFAALAEVNLDAIIQKFWELDEIPHGNRMSPEETECENLFTASVAREEAGRYLVKLPFCAHPNNLGNSRNNAQRRLTSLERKLRHDTELREKYNAVIMEYMEKDYLSKVDTPDLEDIGYYIPHHPVIRKDKPMPRIVLDASAKTHTGLSLNDVLHSGQNLQADLFLLLLDFRLFPVAMTADVQQMYLQIGVCDEDRKYLRILFRFSENDEICTYQFKRVPFGLKCSPFLAMRSLHQLASDMALEYPEAANVIVSKFYMDDLVTSVDNESSAVNLANELVSLFKSGCMKLTKWSSNSLVLLEGLPNSHRSSINFNDEKDSSLKVLGLSWDPTGDVFFFTSNDCLQKCTKRNILSVVARLFDVLGLVAPVILSAKLLIKELWLANIGWDDTPPVDIIQRFSWLAQELPLLTSLKIPRHIGVTKASEVVIIGFCDASLNGYGCVIYLHSTDVSGSISVRLLCSKSRVSPTKITTLARLELCAAVLLSKLLKLVVDTYCKRITIADVYAFSDSTISLSWIHSSPHRWSVFVGNRVAKCQENLPPDKFYHISGVENPSDCVSRGLLPSQLLSHHLWWNGPQWLQRPVKEWPVKKFIATENMQLPERKATVLISSACLEPSLIYDLSERVSSWDKLVRVTVYILRFTKKITSLSNFVECMSRARTYIIHAVQKMHFSDEIKLIKNNLASKKFRNLAVFLDEKEILRVGGRLSNSNLPYEAKHPAILPKKDLIVNLIIRNFHQSNCHAGPGLLMSILRQEYWILDARTVIRARVRECNACFRVNPSHVMPVMADLPACRITEAKAFVHSGVDYAGPLRLILTRRRGQHAQKAYICLFVCLVTKAVHIELATELSSSCFLAAFKRFIARRGPVSVLYSDNGTNFVGARAKLDEMYQLLQNTQHNDNMKRELEGQKILWKMIPPRAPHFGGLWESNIKSLKTHLFRVIGNQLLTYEEMQTILVQIECLMNSRPLSVVSSDPDPEVLTPAHFLMSTPLKSFPVSDLPASPVNLINRKKLLDDIVMSYWKRWRMEYLHTLQVRQKWDKKTDSINIGTVVIVGQDNTPPLSWPLGIITEVFPGTDRAVRVVMVRVGNNVYKRPVKKLYPLPCQ